MPRIALHVPAPDFALKDYKGEIFHLSDLKGKNDVLLVFNRTFT